MGQPSYNISPSHRPGSTKVMGTPQYITHLTLSQARFDKGDGHTTVYHAVPHPLTGQVQQTKVMGTPQYIMQCLTLSQDRLRRQRLWAHHSMSSMSHPLTGQVQQRRWAHHSISFNVPPSYRPDSEDKGDGHTTVYHAVPDPLTGQVQQRQQVHWSISCNVSPSHRPVYKAKATGTLGCIMHYSGNTEIMKYLTFSLARYTGQKLMEIQRYVTMSHLVTGQVQKTKRLWEYRGAMQCLTFSIAKCRRHKVMGIQRYHGRNVSPSYWPCAGDKRWWEYRGTMQCLTFLLATCRRKVMGVQRYYAMSYLLTGQVQKTGDGNTEVSLNASPFIGQVQKENKGDRNTEVSHNVSSRWPGAEGK